MADFDWPWEYNFPPFFTLQPNNETRTRQLTVWNNLTRNYYKHRNQSSLDINEDSPLFCNNALKRRLPTEGRLAVMEHLQGTGHAAPLDKRRTNWQVYWHTLDEWAKIIYDWSQRTGQTNSVCTIYEISNGDNSVGEEFHELDQDVVLKALKLLEEQGKCELMLFDDSQGVKFF
ncbi:unnamed protein product [Hermetia illucens]|uniref:Vacuolar protein-sorting-associated protein 25 n=1 Tax=Hermetia illucens TaxID=343691 RepID=A0A7R8UYY2_HERIL|nr:vacuolar protein-sorting-associated protein 25 [Hermetia illucens]CAD7089166.1 unnamed protein product [Hermetia illucens]